MTDILIEAGANAFGDANHPTTALLLDALDGLAGQMQPARICDMGCGSGVLSIRAAQLWPDASIIAADLERSAVEAARRNAVANGVTLTEYVHQTLTPTLSLGKGEGEENPRPQRGRGQGEGDIQQARLLEFARELRHNSTDAETRLWSILRNRQLLGLKFRRQHRVQGYIADFACTEEQLIIELDGGQHNSPEAVKKDTQRTQILAQAGWRVLRFWNNEVLQNPEGVVEYLHQTLTPALSLDKREGGLCILHSDGFNHADIFARAPYDLILMNILAEPILRLMAEANDVLAEEGVLLLSGMLEWQQQPILEAGQSLGLELTHRFREGEWVAHVWQKA